MVSALATLSVLAEETRRDSGIGRFHELGEPRRQVSGDAFRSVPVPELRYSSPLAAPGEDLGNAAQNQRPLSSHDRVGPLLDRDRTLGILTHGQARHAECSGL